MLRRIVLVACFVVCLCSLSASAQSPEYPPAIVRAQITREKNSRKYPRQCCRIAVISPQQVEKKEASDLARLAQDVPDQVKKANNGLLPKDLENNSNRSRNSPRSCARR